MNSTNDNLDLSNENILIITNILTAGLALLSEIMAVSKCKQNGLIDIFLKTCKKTLSAANDNQDDLV
jgi:hypothetical protein